MGVQQFTVALALDQAQSRQQRRHREDEASRNGARLRRVIGRFLTSFECRKPGGP